MHIALFLVGALLLASASHAATPCDFKGISVGNNMTPPEIMSMLGVSKYKMNPTRPSFEEMKPLYDKYGLLPAAEIEDWNIGPYCAETYCEAPYGIVVGVDTPASVHVAFHQGLVTEIDVSYSETYWDDILPVLNQKYGADWDVEHDDMPITNIESNATSILPRITLNHATNGTNQSTKDRCQIQATNLDIVFEHHDAYGPYHSIFMIKLISKNF
jgi:hypothetical protein